MVTVASMSMMPQQQQQQQQPPSPTSTQQEQRHRSSSLRQAPLPPLRDHRRGLIKSLSTSATDLPLPKLAALGSSSPTWLTMGMGLSQARPSPASARTASPRGSGHTGRSASLSALPLLKNQTPATPLLSLLESAPVEAISRPSPPGLFKTSSSRSSQLSECLGFSTVECDVTELDTPLSASAASSPMLSPAALEPACLMPANSSISRSISIFLNSSSSSNKH